MWHVPLCVTDGVGLERRLRNSETRTEWLDPKKASSRGSPGEFSDLQGAFPKIRKLTGCPTRGAFFRIKSIGQKKTRKRLRTFKSPRRRPTGKSHSHRDRETMMCGLSGDRGAGCGWRQVSRLSLFGWGVLSCVTSAQPRLAVAPSAASRPVGRSARNECACRVLKTCLHVKMRAPYGPS